jgi:hypothetical protein
MSTKQAAASGVRLPLREKLTGYIIYVLNQGHASAVGKQMTPRQDIITSRCK